MAALRVDELHHVRREGADDVGDALPCAVLGPQANMSLHTRTWVSAGTVAGTALAHWIMMFFTRSSLPMAFPTSGIYLARTTAKLYG